MEFVGVKRGKNRKKREHLRKRRSDKIKFEVKLGKRRGSISERGNIFIAKEKLIPNTMQANSFWENYTAAQEWQKRHSVTWWRTRCIALEHENKILRDKLRSVTRRSIKECFVRKQEKGGKDQNIEDHEGTTSNEEIENLEFHVNEDMMSFLEQSMRHRIELKKTRESELFTSQEKEEEENINVHGGAIWMHARNNNAKLLYGEASPRILAMETALQTTVDRHKDKAKPQYWPVIPLKP